MQVNMINRSREHLSPIRAEHLVSDWNAAYPLMRDVVTREIERLRYFIDRKVWEKEVSDLSAEAFPDSRMTEARIRRRLKHVKALRLELGQLDRGEHRPCTQSPKTFTVVAAHSRVTEVIRIASSGQEGMAPVYRLSALLSEEHDRWLIRMRKSGN